MPFVDDKWQAILDDKGQPMMRPAGLDPHFFVSQGLKDKEIMNELRLSANAGEAAALASLGERLLRFYRWHAWDAQHIGGSFHEEFIDSATVAIGLYAAALGLSRDEILHIEDWWLAEVTITTPQRRIQPIVIFPNATCITPIAVISSISRAASFHQSLKELAQRLNEHGLQETEDSITSKLGRGTFAASFFLAVLTVLELEGVTLSNL